MTDELKNKLTERFEFLAKRSEEQVSADIYDALLKAYLAGGEYGYQYAQQHPAWVSVEDELPKITIDGWRSEDVFFATDDGKSHFGFYSNKGVWFSSVYGFNGHQVTHWMPLPTKPVKKGGEDEND